MNSPAQPLPTRVWSWKLVPLAAMTLLLLAFLVRALGGIDAILAAFADADWSRAYLPGIYLMANLVLSVMRWQTVLSAMGHPIPFRRGLSVVLATWPLALIAPSRATDILRALGIRERVPFFAGAGSVLAEKAMDLQSLCLLAAIGSAVYGLWPIFAFAVTLMIGEWLLVYVGTRHHDWLFSHRRLQRFHDKFVSFVSAFEALLAHPRQLGLLFVCSISAWLFAIGIIYELLVMMHAGVPLLVLLAVWPLAIFAGMLPVSLAGMGTRDAAFIYLLGRIGVTAPPTSSVLAATFGYSIVGTWIFAIVGLPLSVRFIMHYLRPKESKTNV